MSQGKQDTAARAAAKENDNQNKQDKAAQEETMSAGTTAQAELETLRAELEAEKKKTADAEAAKQAAESKLASMGNEAEEQAAKEEEVLARQIRAMRKVRIVIPSGKSEKERFPVPVQVNGQAFLIKRDEEVNVPEAVCSALDLAVECVPVVVGEGENRRTEMHSAPAYPYRKLGYVNPDTGKLEGFA